MQRAVRVTRLLFAACVVATILLAPNALATKDPRPPLRTLIRRFIARAFDWISIPPGFVTLK